MSESSDKNAKSGVRKFTEFVFGSFRYQPPGFINYIRVRIRRKKTEASDGSEGQDKGSGKNKSRRRFLLAAGTAALLLVVSYGYHMWKQSRPQLVKVSYSVVNPVKRMKENGLKSPLEINFKGSAAPKEFAGKRLPEGPSVTPEVSGYWEWEGDSRLVFHPDRMWEIGKTYKVKMEPRFFPGYITLSKWDFSFAIPPLSARFTKSEFYIDPVNGNIKRVTASVRFNYPVDVSSVKERISIKPDLKGDSGSLKNRKYSYELKTDDEKKTVHIVSEKIGMPAEDVVMVIKLDKGVKPLWEGKALADGSEARVTIPGIGTYVKVNSIKFRLIRNERQIYDQVLIIDTKGEIRPADLKKYLEVWQLPVDLPEQPGLKRVRNFRWGDNGAEFVTAKVLSLSTRIDPVALPIEGERSSLNSFSLKVQPKRFLYVKIRKGAPFHGGYTLSSDRDAVVYVKPFPRELEFLSDGNLLAMSGSRRLTLLSRGISKVEYRINRIIPDDINHLVSQSNGDITDLRFENYYFDIDNISERYIKKINLNLDSPNSVKYFSLDMSRYLNTIPDKRLRYGLFYLEVGENPGSERNFRAKDSRLIMVTDLGILVKKSRDGSRDVFVQSIATGMPVQGAAVSVIGKNGNFIEKKVTGGSGHVFFKPLVFEKDYNAPVAFVVTNGNDLSFIPYKAPGRSLDYSSFDVGGVYGASDKDKLTAFLFSDRGIYRPGDTMNIGIIVKTGNWNSRMAGAPLVAVITDSRGQSILEHPFALSSDGFAEISHSLYDSSPTGEYSVDLYLKDKNNRKHHIGGTTVKVEEFLADRLNVSVKFSSRSRGWINPDDLEGEVSVRNLYGTPAAGHRVDFKMVLNPARLWFPEYKDYHFLHPEKEGTSHSEDLPGGKTDDKGAAAVPLRLERFEKATYRLDLYVTAFEKDETRSVSSEASVIVSPLEALVGYKADGDLDFIYKNSERKVSLIGVNSGLEKITLSGLKLDIKKSSYISTLVKQPDGLYKFQSVEKKKPYKTFELSISTEGTDIALPTAEAGTYQAEILDKSGEVLNRFSYTVVGETNMDRSLDRIAELNIRLNKNDFKPGETAEIAITAPYTGTGLITIEREKVYSFKWFRMDTTSSIQHIKIPESGLEGNGYISVAFIRALDSDAAYMTPLSYGAVPFSISREKRTHDLKLKFPGKVKPGEDFTVTYSSDKKGRAVLYIVDEGILQVARYKTPKPLDYFFRKRALEVSSSQILDLILPEFSVIKNTMAAGGGAGSDMLAANLNPFKRRSRAPVVYWSGIVGIGRTPGKITYHVPDYFNGTLRVMAVAVSSDAIGSAEGKAVVKGDFVIQPNMPVFVAPGDEFVVSATVANNLAGAGDSAEVEIGLTGSGSFDIPSGTKKIVIPEGKDLSVSFPVTAGLPLGEGSLVITAGIGNVKSRISTSISIRPVVPYHTDIKTGIAKRGKEKVKTGEDFYPEYRNLEVSASFLPLGLAGGMSFYLEKYPFECSEQVISRTYPLLYTDLVKDFGYKTVSPESEIQKGIAILMSRQRQDGGFGAWTSSSDPDPFIDLYGFQFLLEAEKHDRYVPVQMLKKAASRVEKIADMKETGEYDLILRSYAILLLTRNGKITTRYIEKLRKDLKKNLPGWRSHFTGIYLAGAYSLMKMNSEANLILREVHRDLRTDKIDRNYYNMLTYYALYLDTLSVYFPSRLSSFSEVLLNGISEELMENRYATFSASAALTAIGDYVKAAGSASSGEYEILQLFDGKTSSPLKLTGGNLKKADFSSDASALEISNSSSSPLFYQVCQAGFRRNPPEVEKGAGMEIIREYLDGSGRPVTEMVHGKTYTARIRVRATDGKEHTRTAVVDLLPASMELVREDIRSGRNTNISASYIDLREDRIIIFGPVTSKLTEYTFPVRAVYSGMYRVPPPYVEDMYDRSSWATNKGGVITVK